LIASLSHYLQRFSDPGAAFGVGQEIAMQGLVVGGRIARIAASRKFAKISAGSNVTISSTLRTRRRHSIGWSAGD